MTPAKTILSALQKCQSKMPDGLVEIDEMPSNLAPTAFLPEGRLR
jgi:hypothetical protein